MRKINFGANLLPKTRLWHKKIRNSMRKKKNWSGKLILKLRTLILPNKKKKVNAMYLRNKLRSWERKISNWPQRLRNMAMNIQISKLTRNSRKPNQPHSPHQPKPQLQLLTIRTITTRRKINQTSRFQFKLLKRMKKNQLQLFKRQPVKKKIKKAVRTRTSLQKNKNLRLPKKKRIQKRIKRNKKLQGKTKRRKKLQRKLSQLKKKKLRRNSRPQRNNRLQRNSKRQRKYKQRRSPHKDQSNLLLLKLNWKLSSNLQKRKRVNSREVNNLRTKIKRSES